MSIFKIIFLLILLVMERCGIIKPSPVKGDYTPIAARRAGNTLNGSWRLANADLRVANKDSIFLPTEDNEMNEDLLLSFFPDSSFTRINKGNGEFLVGKWKYNSSDSALSMVYKNKTESYHALYSIAEGVQLVQLKASSGKDLFLGGFGRSMENYEEDPFYAKHNYWRQKPLKSETEGEVLNRLQNYLQHNINLLKAAESRQQQIISWEFSKGILKIYNSGIGLVPKEQIPENWLNSFYSQEEALKAYDMIDNYLRTTSYKGAPTGNWVKDDYKILQSIADGLKKTVQNS